MTDIDKGFEERGWTRNDTPEDRAMFGDLPEAKPKKANKLDDEKHTSLFRRLLSIYQQELDRQQVNRHQMSIDYDFYDNIQWTEEDKAVLERRGQSAICYNVISTTVNWVINSQKRMRGDFKILPRRKEDGKNAERKSQLMKYLSDVNRTEYDVSEAFGDAVKGGVGWLEDGAQSDTDGEPVYSRYESWRNMLWDSACTEKDLSDARYVIRSKWVDTDIAYALAPDRKGIIDAASQDADSFGLDMESGDEAMDSQEMELDAYNSNGRVDLYKRSRVRLIEIWFKEVKDVQKLKGGQFNAELYDPESRGQQEAINTGEAVVIEKTEMRMHVAIICSAGLLWFSESPYRHNDFPFTPVWGNRRSRDGMPYGIIRLLRDIQEDINKRASKALAILSSNKVVMDEGAVDDLDEFEEEVARPDAIIVKKQGKKLDLNADRELAPAHLDLMSRSIMLVQSVGGVTDESMGRSTNATSGRAIQARQEQGQVSTGHFFDNLRLARAVQGEKQLSLIEQFFTEEKQFRITNTRGTPEYINVNDGLPEHDVTRTKADFVITESDWNASMRQAQTQELLELLMQIGPVAPQVVLAMLDLVVESMDIGGREELVKRIRAITGQRDPDSEELTPEEIQRMQQQQKQAEMQERAMMADIAKKEGEAAYSMARAEKTTSEIEKVAAEIGKLKADLASTNVQSQMHALETALQLAINPALSGIADTILSESGFISRTAAEQKLAQMQKAERLQAESQMLEQQRQQAMAQEEQQIMQQVQQEQRQAEQMQQQGRGLPQGGMNEQGQV